MPSSVATQQCDYLDPRALANAPTDVREQLVHINNQISAIDSHVSQLIAMRDGLRRRSRQLHNMLLPIYNIPTEILSYIFQLAVNLSVRHLTRTSLYRHCLPRALDLSSVSFHFHHVAFCTPELWQRVPLFLTSRQAVCKASSLLRHCVTVAPMLKITVSETLVKEEARPAIDILLTPDVTQKIGTFDLYKSIYASDLWIEKLRISSFPMLGTLRIRFPPKHRGYNFGALKALTKLSLDHYGLENILMTHPIIVPPTLRYLNSGYCSEEGLLSLLRQTPNLVECVAKIEVFNGGTRITGPLTLNHLRRLSLLANFRAETRSLAQYLRLPSLEALKLTVSGTNGLQAFIPLCRVISTTVSTLTITVVWFTLDSKDLYQLCRLPFPKLRKLKITSDIFKSIQNIIQALTPVGGENSNTETCYLPALDSIILHCNGYDTEPQYLLDSLKRWSIGDAFDFCIQHDLGEGEVCDADLDGWSSKPMVQLSPLVSGTTRGVRIRHRLS
jgi:hypothetical protein